ncbi:MAG: hypothetical protein V3V15_03910 [Sphingorhabdus sp.]
MRKIALFVLLTFCALPVFSAEPAKRIGFGSDTSVSIEIGQSGDQPEVTIVETAKPILTEADKVVIRKFVGGEFDYSSGSNVTPITAGKAGIPEFEPVKEGRVKFSFIRIDPQGQAMLLIENGYGRGLIYRARMIIKGRSSPTDVCLVMPNRRGYEHWPHLIDEIQLSNFTFVDWNEGDKIPCA